MATLANQPWYCGSNTIWDSILGCDAYLPTAADQVTMMQQNFGPSANPQMVQSATSDFQNWLQTTGYDQTMNNLKCQDSLLGCSPFGNIPWTMIGLVVVGMFAISILTSGSPRRYGR